MNSTHGSDNQIAKLLDMIAREESTDVTDLKPLMDAVDTDALKSLLDSDTDVSVTFEYLDYTVYLASDGNVEID